MPQNSRFSQRDATWRTGGPSVHASGDGLEGAYSAILHAVPSGGTCKVIVPALSLTQPKDAFCSQTFTGSVGDIVLVMFDENKEPWVLSNVSNNPAPPGHEWAYQQITSQFSVTATTLATAQTVITATFTPDGSDVIAEFWTPYLETGTAVGTQINTVLAEGATTLTIWSASYSASGGNLLHPAHNLFRFTPTAAAHTYTVKAYLSQASPAAVVGAGVGGSGGYAPAFVRFTKV